MSQPWEQGSLHISSHLYFTKHVHICDLFLLSHNAVNYYRKSKREELKNQQSRWLIKITLWTATVSCCTWLKSLIWSLMKHPLAKYLLMQKTLFLRVVESFLIKMQKWKLVGNNYIKQRGGRYREQVLRCSADTQDHRGEWHFEGRHSFCSEICEG